ncbi:MAG: hypothetical protein DRG59_11320 [Deltaproteobacteria bacterium]|nr:MAG: hypothetical protein DRG59_11320 [Deltaproteobacteria bacterium]
MSEMYFDIEVAYRNPEIIARMLEGRKIPGPNPGNCKIITIQYQLLDESGNPKTPLRIFKEWDTSEEDIIRKIATMINPQRLWEFIPVGHNIYFDLGMLKERAALYGIRYSNWFIYNELPSIDIKHICIGMNSFRLKDSGLDKFSGKETSGRDVPLWYYRKEYDKIIDYVTKEAKEFIEFYKRLRETLPDFRKQYGFF